MQIKMQDYMLCDIDNQKLFEVKCLFNLTEFLMIKRIKNNL